MSTPGERWSAPRLITSRGATHWRFPKLYDDDTRRWTFALSDGRQETLTFRWVVDSAFRNPWEWGVPFYNRKPTVAEAIEWLTGYSVTREPYARDYPWSHRVARKDAAIRDENMEMMRQVRPAHRGTMHLYYYRRDVTAYWLPRWRCESCGKKAPRLPHECHYCNARACSEECHDRLASGVCSVCGTRLIFKNVIYGFGKGFHSSGSVVCTRRCSRFEASKTFAKLHGREVRKWREHTSKPVCSPECHDKVAAEYRLLTLDAKEMREWVTDGKQKLAEVTEVARRKLGRPSLRRRAHSRSQHGASTPPQSSVDSSVAS